MSAPTSQQLRAESSSLETRAAQIGAELQSARQSAQEAQSAFIEGRTDSAALMEAGREVSALERAVEAIVQRIQTKRAEARRAEANELRDVLIEEAAAHASRFLSLRAEVEEDAARVVLWLEAQGEDIVSRLDAASDAAQQFARTVEGIENPPSTFETSDGQSVRATHIQGEGNPLALLALYRRAFQIVPADKAFMALYEGARFEQQTQWLQSFHTQRDQTALRPDAAQMAQNQAREKEFGRPFTEEEQHQDEARRLNSQAQEARRRAEQVHIGRPRIETAPGPGESVPEAIDREAQERRTEAEARFRREEAETAV